MMMQSGILVSISVLVEGLLHDDAKWDSCVDKWT
jgi:hypothetical protein